jgi:branched-chain amino acid transport system permease protein
MGSLWGSVFGAILLTLLPEVLHAFQEYNVLMYGFILMVVLVFFPRGLFPAVAGVFAKRGTAVAPDSREQLALEKRV